MTVSIRKLAVCGAGTMGAQIALHIALHGYSVSLFDISEEQLRHADSTLRSLMSRKLTKGKVTQSEIDDAFNNLDYTTDIAQACHDADLVIEAIVEDLDIKRSLFQQLNQVAPDSAILATNSSSIVSSKLADSIDNAERLCNIHFFNPALVLPLVEVVQGPHTSDATVKAVIDFVKDIGKTPVHIEKEIFGFITNRILAVIFDEAISLYEQGVASIETIDTAVKAGLNHPLGPFELLDMTGIDVNYGIKVLQAEDSGDPTQGPSKTLTELYQKGLMGRKTGQGFYTYEKEKP
ncbi:3-hydroxyacyl-CoA dehydrogenase family protein [Corynebacterium sp. 153RC1]|uniref:3-hydroxyacyl-CoA dehydrogenase family protein n=1 Tax=unclassified Corynebacterium TaxID=2624378 RepID=UPI00211BCABD|nr:MULTISPECIES: 3-hydroxyacyl-CoA dehydrogenase family protein [unclassified Corynebacterium]MCQ9353426.1 3-hydroxyacyl-CoA dehydrogenase family protein [Corynebacterium sp. 209RC1]MCQ9355648.1 3-hydroxyacyl-CoA dehydrogenase family protein [Corynebacterium sp. 1222RC1]MCQ9357841.1 3-hydroxyacyl-CoA dehydrogenase family protein [Corynebacterium sp. 122RC1]MCQ9360025.1 3-hydroxyacyl-CoA dehydrogenase family protein [Corynebacterium sp. 142RC1]MCQ9362169.1 3-hydroxyacyl-CoA dehydrogenase family